jgi:ribonuclease R
MRDRIGEEFDGTIAAVVPFGVFVALDSVYVEGLVHVSELGEDYFQYDNIKHQMLGERSGKRYRLGDRLHVKLVRADLETNKIDFVLIREGQPANGHKSVARGGQKVSARTPLKASVKPVRKAQAETPAKRPAKALPKAKSTGKAAPKRSSKAVAKPAAKKAAKRR